MTYTVYTYDTVCVINEVEAETPEDAVNKGCENPSCCHQCPQPVGAPWVVVEDEEGNTLYDDSLHADQNVKVRKLEDKLREIRQLVAELQKTL